MDSGAPTGAIIDSVIGDWFFSIVEAVDHVAGAAVTCVYGLPHT